MVRVRVRVGVRVRVRVRVRNRLKLTLTYPSPIPNQVAPAGGNPKSWASSVKLATLPPATLTPPVGQADTP